MSLFARIVLTVGLALAVAPQSAIAAVHHVSAALTHVDLTRNVQFLVDRTATLTAPQVAALAAEGKMPEVKAAQIPMFRIDRGEAFWIKYDVAADASAPPQWLLQIGRATLSRVQVFERTPRGDWVGFPETGAALPFSTRAIAHRHFVFPVTLDKGGVTSLLLRVRSAGPASPQASLWQPAALQDADIRLIGLLALYFGVAGGMILYNLLLYISVRDVGYLLYAFGTASAAGAIATNSGLGAQFLWGEWPWWGSHCVYAFFAALGMFMLMLTRHFLMTRERMPRMDTLLKWLARASAVSIPAAFVLPSNVMTGLIIPVGATGVAVIPAMAAWGAWKRWPGARFFLAAWTALYIGVAFTIARALGLTPGDSAIIENFLSIATAVEMVLLALALADRINDEKRQKEDAQNLALGFLTASQALSRETRFEQLHARVCEVVAALSGAATVRFLIRDEELGHWYMFAAGEGSERVDIEEAARRGLVNPDALRSVETTGEPYAGGGLFVMPIFHHGSLSAMLQLEMGDASAASPEAARAAIESIAGPLAVSLENARLVQRLESRVEERTRELRETQQELVATARRAGMAEVATNVLHNVGNTLNSVNVDGELMRTTFALTRLKGLDRALDVLDEHQKELGPFLESNPKGRLLRPYLRSLSEELHREMREQEGRLNRLLQNIDHIKRIVAVQQTLAGPSIVTAPVLPQQLVEDALRLAQAPRSHPGIRVEKDVAPLPLVRLDKTRIVQILVNLLDNATQAVAESGAPGGRITVRAEPGGDSTLRFTVTDNGCGIAEADMAKIFAHGYTTRAHGHGFGLHSCALAATEMGGTLRAHSGGPGQGATFVLEMPLVQP